MNFLKITDPMPEVESIFADLFAFFVNLFSYLSNAFKNFG